MTAPRDDAVTTVGTVDVAGGPLAYLARGGGPGTPLLLVHGFTGTKEDFVPVLGDLADDRWVAAIDLPGHGDAAGDDDPEAYTLPRLASTVLAAADALGLARFHLLGHSLGGLVAQRVAEGPRVRGLVLASSGLGAPPDEALDGLGAIAREVQRGGLEAGLAEQRRRDERPAGDPARALTERRFLAMRPAAVVGTARALATAAPRGAFLRGIDVPVLVLHGEDEDIWPEAAQRLLTATIAGARRAVVPGGHAAQVDAPRPWAARVAMFLREVDRQADRAYRGSAQPE